jgi:hypothetical protein
MPHAAPAACCQAWPPTKERANCSTFTAPLPRQSGRYAGRRSTRWSGVDRRALRRPSFRPRYPRASGAHGLVLHVSSRSPRSASPSFGLICCSR